MRKLGLLAVALAVGVGCSGSGKAPVDSGNPEVGTDAGTDAGVDAGVDAGTDAGADAGVDAGTDGGTDAGTDGGTITFGTPGPWPVANVTYGAADGIQEAPVVGVTTDEPVTLNGKLTQNLWVATNSALYLLRPGETKFHRYDAADGLHLQSNPVCYDDSSFSGGDRSSKICGAAVDPGISEIVGGGPNEVFVGYWGNITTGDWSDPYRHTGKLDRVRLKEDGTLDVARFDMVANTSVEFWENRTPERMIYDHFIHKHELYVGTNHGVDKFSPDLYHPTIPGVWFNSAQNNWQWMSDHLHPHACYHQVCDNSGGNQRLGDFRALAIDTAGDLWVGGRWAAGKIRYTAKNSVWWTSPRTDDKLNAIDPAFGDGYTSFCEPGYGRPVFCVPQEGDNVNLSAAAVTKDPHTGQDRIWYSSGIIYNDPEDVNYGVAAFLLHPDTSAGQQMWTYFDPIRDIGMAESNVRDMVALPDGRLVLAGPSTGLVIWDPVKGTHVSIRAGQGIPSDQVLRLDLDTMVNPPALHVATAGGAAVLRKLP